MSIPIIWSLANYTNVLTNDPALWFAMMLMPVGPPAMKLLALADVNDVDEEITMSIARLLTVSYPGLGTRRGVRARLLTSALDLICCHTSHFVCSCRGAQGFGISWEIGATTTAKTCTCTMEQWRTLHGKDLTSVTTGLIHRLEPERINRALIPNSGLEILLSSLGNRHNHIATLWSRRWLLWVL